MKEGIKMMSVITSNNKVKIEKQIKGLEWVLENDTNEKDIEYHQLALDNLKNQLNEL